MEQQNVERKTLKKAYRRAKRAYMGAWKGTGIVLTLLALACTLLVTAPQQYISFVTPYLDVYGVNRKILIFTAAVCGFSALLCFIGCAVQRKKLKRSPQYLDYKTAKNTVKAEKEMRE